MEGMEGPPSPQIYHKVHTDEKQRKEGRRNSFGGAPYASVARYRVDIHPARRVANSLAHGGAISREIPGNCSQLAEDARESHSREQSTIHRKGRGGVGGEEGPHVINM